MAVIVFFNYCNRDPQTCYEHVQSVASFIVYVVSPPQMAVPLKYMYNANILRADFTTFVPSHTPM